MGGIVRPRRDVIPEGGTPPVVPEVTGTVPTGPSGTPIVTLGGGIEGKPAPETPAPGGNVTGIPSAANPVVDKQPEVQGPSAEVMGPPDWWDAMPVSSRDDLIRQIETLQFNTGQLENALAAERNARQALEGQLAGLRPQGEPQLAALLANPPWATPDQIPPIPPIPPDFRTTGEYGNLIGANVGQDQQLGRLRRDVDNVALGVGNAQADVGALRRVLEGISANPNLVPIPPSAQMLSDSIAAYFSLDTNRAMLKGDRGLKGDKGDKGEKGDTGPSLPVDQINGAINDYLRRNPPLAGRDGQPGKDGRNGVDGRTPTPDEVRGVVEEVLSGVRVFLSSPTDFIWDVILKGIRTRIIDLFIALEAR